MDSTITKEERQLLTIAFTVAGVIALAAFIAIGMVVHVDRRLTAVDDHAWQGVRQSNKQDDEQRLAGKGLITASELARSADASAKAALTWANQFDGQYKVNQGEQARVNAAINQRLKAQAKAIEDLQKQVGGARIVGEHK